MEGRKEESGEDEREEGKGAGDQAGLGRGGGASHGCHGLCVLIHHASMHRLLD